MTNRNRVYYGEYTLTHWIDLILTENIELPDYQRCFVWEKEKSIALIKALSENQFVPPVTIGSYYENGKSRNLILDGQQRLTSILLSYLNLFPNENQKNLKTSEIYFADENDDENDDVETNFKEWNFNQLIKMVNKENLRDRSAINKKALENDYETMGIDYDKDIFDDCYLGFSFIVPATKESKEQQRFYSKAFRSINIEGKVLLPLESREALYYLNKDLVELFSPTFTKSISIKESKMDFVRYLSFLSQYEKTGSRRITRGYTKDHESYFENFIYSVVDDTDTGDFIKLSSKIENLDYVSRIEYLGKVIDEMGLKKTYDSIIDLDMYMFGIVFYIVFENKKITDGSYVTFKDKIEKKTEELKANYLHVKNPSALKHLEIRVDESIKICKEFIDE